MANTSTSPGRAPAQADGAYPRYFRLPSPGQTDRFFDANRSFWNERVLPTPRNEFKPPVRSIVSKQKGATRGIRFIVFESAKSYFDALEKGSQVTA
jgi:hypothetical protein